MNNQNAATPPIVAWLVWAPDGDECEYYVFTDRVDADDRQMEFDERDPQNEHAIEALVCHPTNANKKGSGIKSGWFSTLLQRIVVSWDQLVYRLAYRSMTRMLRRNQGLAYLFELNLRRYREQNPIPERLMTSTESFMDAMGDLAAKSKSAGLRG